MKRKIIIVIAIVALGFLLRFNAVSYNPPGLYMDEVSIGNNAYSILKTGKDEYGITHPLWFKSFGDYKMPAYIYAVAGSMIVFGKTEFAIRFPSIIAGTLTILVLYLFLDKIIQKETNKILQKKLKYLPLLASFLLAISSWHIQFSRGGFEINLATLFYLLGWHFFIRFKAKKQLRSIILSLLFFLFAMYTYHTFRLLTPVALVYIAFNQRFYKNTQSLYIIISALLLSLPMILFSLTPQGNQRFVITSAFSQLGITDIVQKIITYPLLYMNNYLSFFSFDFLFNFGDGMGRHQMSNFGELYRWQLPFFLGGIYLLLRQHRSVLAFMTFLLFFTTPLAASIAAPSPHALRSLPLVIPCVIFIAVGILFFIQSLKRYKVAVGLVVILIACFEFFFYLHFYYVHYSQVNQLDWGGGYKQLVVAASQPKYKNKNIVIDQTLSFAPDYLHFYNSSLHFTMVPTTWIKPKNWSENSLLYIRPYYGKTKGEHIIENVYLININHDIFAQFWNTQQ